MARVVVQTRQRLAVFIDVDLTKPPVIASAESLRAMNAETHFAKQ